MAVDERVLPEPAPTVRAVDICPAIEVDLDDRAALPALPALLGLV